MKKYLRSICIRLLILLTASCFAMVHGKSAIQLGVMEDFMGAEKLHDSLQNLGHQSYLTTFEKNDATLFRVRIGPFESRGDAERYSRFHEFRKAWIDNIPKPGALFDGKTIRYFQTSGRFQNERKYYLYRFRLHDAVGIYMIPYKSGRKTGPADLILHFPKSLGLMIVENVTGFQETDSSLFFGRAVKVFSNPSGKDVDFFNREMRAMATMSALTPEDVRENLLYFNNGKDAYLRVLCELKFKDLNTEISKDIGFDYTNKRGRKLKWQGNAENQDLGNSFLEKINWKKKHFYEDDKIVLFFKENPRTAEAEVGLAFKFED